MVYNGMSAVQIVLFFIQIHRLAEETVSHAHQRLYEYNFRYNIII